MSRYLLELRDIDRNLIADVSGAAMRREFEWVRNRASTTQVTFDANWLFDLSKRININLWDELIGVNQNELRVYRDEKPIIGGQVANAQVTGETDNENVEMIGVGWFDMMGQLHRRTPRTFNQVDQGEIMWQLMNDAQSNTNADYGITKGSVPASKDRDRTYDRDKNIKEAIIQMSEVIDGPDFEVTWDKVFNVYHPKQGRRKNEILRYPGNVDSISFERDGLAMKDRIIARGAGFGEDALRVTADNTPAQQKYKTREELIDFNDISRESTLQDHADEELESKVKFLDIPTFTLNNQRDPKFGSYWIGDEFYFESPDTLYEPLENWYRIDRIRLTVEPNGVETVELTVVNV